MTRRSALRRFRLFRAVLARAAIGVILVTLSGAAALAQGVDASPQQPEETAAERAERRQALFEALRAAKDEREAQAAEEAIWSFWFEAPTPEVAALMDRAMKLRRVYAYEEARETLDKVVAAAPDYAEGWNQRAFVLFLQQRYDRSLEDIARTLELEPDHFGALAGRVQILIRQGRMILARNALRRAAQANPWIARRSPPPGLPGGMPKDLLEPGEDI